MVRKGDDKWYDIVRWTHFATLVAESLGVTSKNIDSFADTKIPDIRRLLGQESNLGKVTGAGRRMGREHRPPGRQLWRDVRAGYHAVGVGPRQERALDQGRAAVCAAVTVAGATSWRPENPHEPLPPPSGTGNAAYEVDQPLVCDHERVGRRRSRMHQPIADRDVCSAPPDRFRTGGPISSARRRNFCRYTRGCWHDAPDVPTAY